jgi:hypothetical protein
LDTAVAASFQTWAQNATAEELAAGPRAEQLGTRTTVGAAAGQIAASPLFPYLVDLAGNDNPAADDEPRSQMDQAVLQGFAEHDQYTSYASAAARLLTYPELARRLGRPLERALQQRAEAGTGTDAGPAASAIGATALEAWLYLCSTQAISRHRLLAFLTDLPDLIASIPAQMTSRLPRITGLAHEHFGDDSLLGVLQQLAGIPDAEADAAFELALADLRRALNAEDQESFIHAAARARNGFAAVEATGEARHDAQAYAAALDAIAAFGRSDPAPLREAVTRLDTAVSQHHAWLSGSYQPPWTWTRNRAETAWLQLSASLSAAADTLHADCWYHPSQALAVLRDAYIAGRSFTTRAGTGPYGVEALIQPPIEGAFLRDANRLALLDHALATDQSLTADEAARQLHASVHAALSALGTSRPRVTDNEAGDGLGKGHSRLPAVLKYFSIQNAETLAAGLSLPVQEQIESLLWNENIARAETGSYKIDRKLQELHQDLAASPDWNGPTAGPFKILLQQTILYLASRYNIGTAMGGSRTAFLRAAGPSTPLEQHLQQDYYEWLTQGPIYNIIHAEPINRGRGRADVLVKFRDVSFCVECKRELHDASRHGLRAYLGQAAVYTDTDAALGILLTLDLTTPSTGAADLFSSVWVEQVQREQELHPRHIVICRLPGSKRDPSATKTPGPASPPTGELPP